MTIEVQPATADRWDDLVTLFGPRGAYDGCWCMFWRLRGAEYAAGRGDGNQAGLEALVASGAEPGLLAYDNDRPVGWAAIAPRSEFGRILRSPTLRPRDDSDDRAVWSLNCFFVDRSARRRGVARALLRAAVEFAGERGATAVEAYPLERGADAASLYVGALDWFTAEGFVPVGAGAGGAKRVVVRRDLTT
jgi:GNAT superfamily N-acetyltransferase